MPCKGLRIRPSLIGYDFLQNIEWGIVSLSRFGFAPKVKQVSGLGEMLRGFLRGAAFGEIVPISELLQMF